MSFNYLTCPAACAVWVSESFNAALLSFPCLFIKVHIFQAESPGFGLYLRNASEITKQKMGEMCILLMISDRRGDF